MDERPTPPSPTPAAPAPRPRGRRRLPPAEWAEWSDERLLDLRLSDLDLRIEGSGLEPLIDELRARAPRSRDCRFRPHFWLSDEWFCPDGVPGIAIPFYLAHPRLSRLEQSQMLEVEGGTPEWCLRILRHEVGHAIENAYRLRSAAAGSELFGLSLTEALPRALHPQALQQELRPSPRLLVRAEPSRRGLRRDLRGLAHPRFRLGAALPGLDGAAEARVRGRAHEGDRPASRPWSPRRERVEPLSSLRKTLREHYERRRGRYGVDEPDFYDRDLQRLFSERAGARGQSARRGRFLVRCARRRGVWWAAGPTSASTRSTRSSATWSSAAAS